MIVRWPFAKSPMTHDRCEVCGLHLRAKNRVERLTILDDFEYGGSGIVNVYCRKHAKKVKA